MQSSVSYTPLTPPAFLGRAAEVFLQQERDRLRRAGVELPRVRLAGNPSGALVAPEWSSLAPGEQARRQARQGVAMIHSDPCAWSTSRWTTCVEVEHALESHPALREVAVVGVPDEKWGERPKAFVALNPGADNVTEAELIAHVRSHIAGFKTAQDHRIPGQPTAPHG